MRAALASFVWLSLWVAVATPALADGDLFVASFVTGKVTRLDGATGATVYAVSQGASTIDPKFGPDGGLYVSNLYGVGVPGVLRVDPDTGAGLGMFASG